MPEAGNKNKRSKFGEFKPRKIIKPDQPLEYKSVDYLSKFIGPTGKLQSRRRTGFEGQDQRKLASAVKLARFMGLLPYVGSAQGEVDRDARGGRDRFARGPRGPRGPRQDSDGESGAAAAAGDVATDTSRKEG